MFNEMVLHVLDGRTAQETVDEGIRDRLKKSCGSRCKKAGRAARSLGRHAANFGKEVAYGAATYTAATGLAAAGIHLHGKYKRRRHEGVSLRIQKPMKIGDDRRKLWPKKRSDAYRRAMSRYKKETVEMAVKTTAPNTAVPKVKTPKPPQMTRAKVKLDMIKYRRKLKTSSTKPGEKRELKFYDKA